MQLNTKGYYNKQLGLILNWSYLVMLHEWFAKDKEIDLHIEQNFLTRAL